MSALRFTNKIQTTMNGWGTLLLSAANAFAQQEGESFDREAMLEGFASLSTRLPGSRDEVDYRDQYGAYGSFLGLFWIESNVVRIPLATKRYLLCESPDVPLFVLVQLLLFQEPNGIGLKLQSNGNWSLEPHSREKRLALLRSKTRVAPFREMLQVIDCLYVLGGSESAYLTKEECLNVLFRDLDYRSSPEGYAHELTVRRHLGITAAFNPLILRNYHILRQTGLISTTPQGYFRIPTSSPIAEARWELIRRTQEFYSGFDNIVVDGSDQHIDQQVIAALIDSPWGAYFDGARLGSLGADINSIVGSEEMTAIHKDSLPLLPYSSSNEDPSYSTYTFAEDPEAIRKKLERSSINHSIAERALADMLVGAGHNLLRSKLVDVLSQKEQMFLFEVKSVDHQNVLSQTRKAVEQLHEYRFRHDLPQDTRKVLLYNQMPVGIPDWAPEFIQRDQRIAIAWLDGTERLQTTTESSWLSHELGI